MVQWGLNLTRASLILGIDMKDEYEDNTLSILERLEELALWMPKDLGLAYVKSGEKTVKLITQENNPVSKRYRESMKERIENVGWTVDESDVKIKEIPKYSPHEQFIIDQHVSSQNWNCNCERPISSFPLSKGVWRQTDEKFQTAYEDDGENTTILWSVNVTCPSCGMEIPLTPLQFGLMLTVKYSEVGKI
jgi:adenine-specific DNA methylase